MKNFIIDSSSLIEFEEKYPKDIFPSLYSLCTEMFDEGDLFSVVEVYNELKDSKEYWKEYKSCFRDLTEKESQNLQQIMSCDKFEVFINHGINENDGYWADPHLIACAMSNKGCVIVCEESSKKNPKRKMPYVCDELEIPCVKLLDFFRQNNVSL